MNPPSFNLLAMSQPSRPTDDAPDDDDLEPTLEEIESMFGPQNLPSGELVPMLERQAARLERELAALIGHFENGADLGDQLRNVRLEREDVLTRLEAARFQRDRLN